jgi:hypothetical protein
MEELLNRQESFNIYDKKYNPGNRFYGWFLYYLETALHKNKFLVEREESVNSLHKFFEKNYKIRCHSGSESALPVPYLTGFSGRNAPTVYKTYTRLIDSGIGKFWLDLPLMRQTRFMTYWLKLHHRNIINDNFPLFEKYRHLLKRVPGETNVSSRAQFLIVLYVLFTGTGLGATIFGIEKCSKRSG